MARILAFVLALLLLAGSVDPTRGWLIVLTVLTGVAAFRLRPWRVLAPRPALDVRMASFVLAAMLLAGAVDANRDWLIALSASTGVAAFMPGLLSLENSERRYRKARMRHRSRWEWDWGDDWR